MTTIAQLGLSIESSQAATAAQNLQNVAKGAKDAEAAAGGTTNAFAKAGQEFEEFIRHAQRHILSLAGANESTRAFTGILTHLPIPLLAAAGAIVALTAAYTQGADEANTYAKAIASSGNFAGVSAGQLAFYADSIGKITGNTHEAAAALAALTSSGAVSGGNLASFAQVAVEASRALGVSVKDIAQQFADLANAPLDSTTKLGRALGFLTPQLYEQVRALQADGNAAAAADVAQKALSDSLAKQTKTVEEYKSVWQNIGEVASSAWDKIRGLGRGQTPEELLATLKQQQQAQIDRANSALSNFIAGPTVAGFQGSPALVAQIASLQKIVDARAAEAQKQAEENRFASEYLELQKAIGAELEANATRNAASFAATSSSFSDAVKTAQAEIQRRQDALDAQHDAALISDTAYYDAKRKLIQADANAEIAGLEAQNGLLEQQIAEQARNLALLKQQGTDPGELVKQQAQADADAIAKRAQIASNLNQINIAQINAAGKIDQANAAQEQSNKRLEASYLALVAAGAKYNDQLAKQFSLQLQGIGAGNLARDRASQLADIQSRFADQARQAAEQHDAKQIDDDEFKRRNQAIADGLKTAEGQFDKYYKDLDDKQSDWLNGAEEAFHNYIDAGKNVADLTDKAFTDAFGQMEDAIVTFATTGKGSFKDLANSILADLVRMEVKILESRALAAILGAFGGGAVAASASSGVGELASSGVAFAATGTDYTNGPTVVGESGPELLVPPNGSRIMPNGSWQGGGGPTIVNYNSFGPGSQVAALQAELDRRDEQTKADIYNYINRGRWSPAIRKAAA